MEDREFLNWVADRLVKVYGESENVDFVIKLRSVAQGVYQTRLDLETAREQSEFKTFMDLKGKLINANAEITRLNGLLAEWKLVASDTNDKLNLKFEEITRLRGALERIANRLLYVDDSWRAFEMRDYAREAMKEKP